MFSWRFLTVMTMLDKSLHQGVNDSIPIKNFLTDLKIEKLASSRLHTILITNKYIIYIIHILQLEYCVYF